MSEKIVLAGKKGHYFFYPFEKENILRGNGKFSIIYKGYIESTGESVIIKMLHPKWNNSSVERKRFVGEYLNVFSSQVLPEVYDICELGQNLYIIREYIEGKDLSNYKKDKKLSELVKREGKEKVILKILDSFSQIHSHQIIHGDIKPSNILLVEKDNRVEVRIIDMGLAMKFSSGLKRDKNNPMPFSLMYASPELMLNYPELMHPASDIFSLAVTIYEFLSEGIPYEFTNPALMMSIQLNEPLQSHSKINNATLNVLNQAAFKFKFQKPIQNYNEDYVVKSLRSAIICRYQNIEDFKISLEDSFKIKDGILKRWFG